MCKKNGYALDGEAEAYAKEFLEEMYACRDENFGNARDVRNFFERSVAFQSDRLAALETVDKEALMGLTVDDLQKAAGDEETEEGAKAGEETDAETPGEEKPEEPESSGEEG